MTTDTSERRLERLICEALTGAACDPPPRQSEMVEEYRTRLIADVVTGKLDVREAAAQLIDPGAL